ncbi:uncharacterized protein LOC34621627 [Cyclospora cayetanensis]|uniref:Uncharacterized protein LOC34621627 n=1 Tax=Cyclospora cayetanensis TaxID=88456 RepID=A0A6P6RTI3_9EIME|nr:uncharacterized protein LOC34621627 [Cyclospora cayetanensis]
MPTAEGRRQREQSTRSHSLLIAAKVKLRSFQGVLPLTDRFSKTERSQGSSKEGVSGISSQQVSAGPSTGANKLLLTLASPTECYLHKAPIVSVTVPGAEGDMTVTNHHSPLVARLKGGEVCVREREGADAKRFFVSDGFLFITPPQDDSGCSLAEVLGVEMVPTSMLDREAAAQELQQLLQQAAGAGDQWTKAKALLGQDLLASVMRAAQ